MKILIVEDEIAIAQSICDYLKPHGIQSEMAANYTAAINKIALYQYDCILLDLSLPDGSGNDLLKYLRKLGKTDGVIIISAKETLESRLEGFKDGADDYLIKPFHYSELLVRLQALVRRKNFKGNNNLTFNEIDIDLQGKIVTVNRVAVDLTRTEMDLLLYLMSNERKVISKSAIAEYLSGDMADLLDNYDFIYAHIKNLKRKIQQAGGGDYIKTVYGLGYKWQDDQKVTQ